MAKKTRGVEKERGDGGVEAVSSGVVTQVLRLSMVVFFSYAAFLQHNDPDAALWATTYASGALIVLLRMAGVKVPTGLLMLIVTFLLAWSVQILVLLEVHMMELEELHLLVDKEEGREALGLVTLVVGLILCNIEFNGLFLGLFGSLAIAATVGAVTVAYLVPMAIQCPVESDGHLDTLLT